MCRALIYVKLRTNPGQGEKPNRIQHHKGNTLGKQSFCCCGMFSYEKRGFNFSFLDAGLSPWLIYGRGFWAKLLMHKQPWGLLINVNWCVNGHCDLWKTPPRESGGCSLILFCALFFFHLYLPQCFQKNSCRSRNAPQHCLPSD